MSDIVEIAKNSGNLSALGPPAVAASSLKVMLASRVTRILDERRLSVRAAEETSGYAAADFSRIRRGKLERFTVDRLLAILGALDPQIEMSLIIRPKLTRNAVVERLQAHEQDLRAEGATSLHLFGSAARDEAGPESDVDVFVDYEPASNFSLMELAGMKDLLEQDLGVRVHIATRDSLKPAFLARIEREAIRIF
jgi:predicted nucleotidyltransferase